MNDFCAALIDLGYHDAQAMRGKLEKLLEP